MPRAHRHYTPGMIWHLTHRCHDKQFLLKVERDRQRWTHWAREARKRFGFCILDYCVTCNHVHLLVRDKGGRETIAKSMQLIAGRTAQEYNERKARVGAFWEDRYHATAVESGEHLVRCTAYIGLNMVRAGVVDDPAHWRWCGYADIQTDKRRNQVLDYREIMELSAVNTMEQLQHVYRNLVANCPDEVRKTRQAHWSESIAVGSAGFIDEIREKLGTRVGARRCREQDERFILREPQATYGADFTAEIGSIEAENEYFWNEF